MRLFADHGYDYDKYRRLLKARGVTPKIARKGTAHGSGLDRARWVVEGTFAWLHYEIRADLHLGLLNSPAAASACDDSEPHCDLISLARFPSPAGHTFSSR
jgi:transposase